MMNEKYNKDREQPPCAAEWRRNPMGRQEPIGVFDSGVGGLTVAREIMRQIPNERIVYFGDTARVPYGSKSKETVTKYSRQIIRFLQTENVKQLSLRVIQPVHLRWIPCRRSLTYRLSGW